MVVIDHRPRTWIDGSPIYRYVFTVSSITPGSVQTIATLKPNFRILKIDGSFSDGGDTIYFINHTIGFAAKLTSIAYVSSSGTLQVYIQGGKPSNGIFIVEYIKLT